MFKKFWILFLSIFSICAIKIDLHNLAPEKEGARAFSLKITPSADEYIYHNKVDLTTNSPDVVIQNWENDCPIVEEFDTNFKKNIEIIKEQCIINGTLLIKKDDPLAQLTVSYMTNKMDASDYKIFPLSKPFQENIKQSDKHIQKSPQLKEAEEPISCPAPHQKKQALSDVIQRWITSASSLWLQLLLVFLLGILMSLTPCVYPMIPITVGILHAQAHKSMWYNFARAIAYTLGIAFMFSILGLTAAFTGSLFGKLMNNPLVIIVVVFILLYFALSMFGLYEIKMPSLISKQQTDVKPTGSILSAFLFGFASGTVASPCLTPGLAFLLTFVAHMGNRLLGFLVMFSFGIGMSVPLLLIGTFSTSIKFIPKTGTWMLEVKKIFGLLLIALCFYYLSNILSVTFLLWISASTLLLLGIYEILTFCRHLSPFSQYLRLFIAITGFMGSGTLYYLALQRLLHPAQTQQLIQWQTNYQNALKQAKNKNTIVLVDVGAPYCSICKAIDKCIFNDPLIASIINQTVPVKIDAANSPEYGSLAKKFEIIGVPTILAIDPDNETVRRRWGAELYTMTKQEVGSLFGELIKEEKEQ